MGHDDLAAQLADQAGPAHALAAAARDDDALPKRALKDRLAGVDADLPAADAEPVLRLPGPGRLGGDGRLVRRRRADGFGVEGCAVVAFRGMDQTDIVPERLRPTAAQVRPAEMEVGYEHGKHADGGSMG